MIVITGVSVMLGGSTHEHITSIQWLDTSDGISKRSLVSQLVEFAEQGNALYVGGENGWNQVQVVRTAGQTPYLRSVKDNTYTDNLLYLPRF
jgi:hypothetical protein